MEACVKVKIRGFILLSAFLAISANAQMFDSAMFGGHRATWDSIIGSWSIPQWYEDGKLGIFVHWMVGEVPARDIFYGSDMYRKGGPIYNFHRQTFGDQKTFGYKDFIPLFKMDKFNPEAWADLFVQSGARYVMPIAIYHDGVALYKSNFIKKFNLVDYPGACGKDIVRLLETSVRKRGLRFGVTNQYLENWSYYCHDTAFDNSNPAYAELYNTGEGGPCAGDADDYWPNAKVRASAAFMTLWYNTIIEQIDMFQPDIIFFDVALCRKQYFDMSSKSKFTKYYYDEAARLGKQVAINSKRGAMPYGTDVYDCELGSLDTIRLLFWQTDTQLAGDWMYTIPYNCRPPAGMLRLLIENCSRNGSLMLAIGNAPDGTLPACLTPTLQSMGTWLQKNGEAIYGTRPWKLSGEGPTKSVGMSGAVFTKTDIRFTADKAWTKVFAIGLDWPGPQMVLTSMKSGSFDVSTIDSIYLIGGGKLTYAQDATGLKVNLTGTAAPIANYPYAVKIFLKTPQRDAFTQIEAESCSNKRMGAIKVKTCGEGGQCLDSARSNDWAAYPKVDFGTGANKFEARVSAATIANSNIASIEVRLDDPSGPLVGTLKGACPGGVNSYTTLTCNLTAPATGVHDLYLVWNPGFRSYNLNWFDFKPGNVTAISRVPPAIIQASAGNERVELFDLKGRMIASGDPALTGRTGGRFLGSGIYIRKTRIGSVSSLTKLYVNAASTLNDRKFSY